MRVLVVTNLFPNPYQSNRAPWSRHQIRALAERHEVAIIAPISWIDELRCRSRQGRKFGPDRRTVYDGLPIVYPRYVYPPKIFRASYGQCYLRSVRRTFQESVSDFRPNIIFATWAYPDGWAAVELGQQFGLPVVIKVVGSDIHQLKRYRGRNAGTIDALAHADAVVAVSQDLASQAAQLGIDKAKIHVVYNGVDADLFRPGDRHEARQRLRLQEGPKMLLFVGNLVPIKGLDVLLEACSRLAQCGVRFQCHIIGDGPMRRKLERQARRLGITDQVRWQGAKPQSDLPDWYRAADVIVLPSYSEGIPNVLLEASACGVPFVATRVGGIPEIADQCCCELVAPGDPSQLATSLERALDRDARLHFSLSWSDSAKHLAKVLQQHCIGEIPMNHRLISV